VRTQQFPTLDRFYPKGILHIARWMIFWNIQYVKIVKFGLKLGPLGNREAKLVKNRHDFSNRGRNGMKVALFLHRDHYIEKYPI
jgi:hypothetical protein